MEFLERAVSVRARRLCLEEILLLALRTLAVAFVVLALSRPVITGAGAPGGEAIILLDRSASMRYAEGAGTLFDFAAARVREIHAALPPGSRVVLASFDGDVRFAAGGAPLASRRALNAALAAESPGWGPTDYAVALTEAARISPSFSSGAPAVFLVSDFRRGAAGVPPQAAAGIKGPLYLVPVADRDGVNAGLVGLAPAGRAFTAASTLLEARIANHSSKARGIDVEITVDGRFTTGAHVEAPSTGEASASAVVQRLREPGKHLVRARISEDAYSGDDLRFAVIDEHPLRLALRLGASPRFITAALDAAPAGSFEVIEGGMTDAADGFIFAGDFPASLSEAEGVWRRVREGAFVVVFAGADGESVARFIAASGDPDLAEMVAGGTAGGTYSPRVTGEHPVSEFIRRDSHLSLAGVRLRGVFAIPPDIEGGGVTAVPIVADGVGGPYAFLLFARVGEGTLALFNASAGRSQGDFVLSPLFVPLLFETISFAAGAGEAEAVCGRRAFIPTEAAAAEVEISGPSGPVAARLVALGSGFAYSFKPDEPGFYRYGDAVVAANPAAAEGESRMADLGDLEDAFGGEVLAAGEAFAEVVAARLGGREVAHLFLWAATAMLAAEMILVFFLRHGK